MTPVFLDFEASSLSAYSHPIEIAWVDQDGQGESYLIRPGPDWHDWSHDSEQLHGISRAMLERDGLPLRQVARRAAEALAPERVEVFADQPAWDGEWLRVLLWAAGIRDRIPVYDVAALHGREYRPLVGLDGHATPCTRQLVAAAQAAEAGRQRTRHRALADAQGLWWTWQDIRRRTAEAMQQAAASRAGRLALEG